MSKKDKRFIKTYSQGSLEPTEIWVDRETGVNYLYHAAGYSGGLHLLEQIYTAAMSKLKL